MEVLFPQFVCRFPFGYIKIPDSCSESIKILPSRLKNMRIHPFIRLIRSVPDPLGCLPHCFLPYLWVRVLADLVDEGVPVELV
jgi:hypothetical protein